MEEAVVELFLGKYKEFFLLIFFFSLELIRYQIIFDS